MQGLGLAGDTSRIPYQKPICQVVDDGFALVPNGWAVIKNTDADYYNIAIYNGIFNFFKAIENKTLGLDLDLSEINHQKTVQNVLSSFTNPNYRYLIGDYNGKTHYDVDNKILIDYLPPSANGKYLWNKIFSTFGFTYSGSIFNLPEFEDLWITYPKGVEGNLTTTLIYDALNGGFIPNAGIIYNSILNRFEVLVSQQVYIIKRLYVPGPYTGQLFFLWINGVSQPATMNDNQIISFNAGDYFYSTYTNFYTGQQSVRYDDPVIDNDIVREILRLNTLQSFSEELKEFKITDFVKEILNKYCLTMFTNDHTNEIIFKTITERVTTNVIIDWSEKYVERKDESYIFDTYAQKNNFKYNYNDKEDAHNDGFISIDNINIPASTDVWKSVTYSPLKETNDNFIVGSGSLPAGQRIFKQYDKDVKPVSSTSQVAEIKYKPLSKRFYFLHSKPEHTAVGTVIFGSINSPDSQTFNGNEIPVANFNQLDMNSIIGANYLPMQTILNDSRLHTITLILSKFDVMNLNFDALYYFAQEQQYYLLNKINFKNNDYSTGEFVRVKK
jgi:hypothetical protein